VWWNERKMDGLLEQVQVYRIKGDKHERLFSRREEALAVVFQMSCELHAQQIAQANPNRYDANMMLTDRTAVTLRDLWQPMLRATAMSFNRVYGHQPTVDELLLHDMPFVPTELREQNYVPQIQFAVPLGSSPTSSNSTLSEL